MPFTERGEWWAFVGALLVVMGSFMTWVIAGPFRLAGTDGDGWYTVIGGSAAAMQVWRSRWGSAAVWAGLSFALVAWKFLELGSLTEDDSVWAVSPGGGLYLCAAGAAVCAVQALGRWRAARSTD